LQQRQQQEQVQLQEPELQQQEQEQERLLLFCHKQTETEPAERRAVRNVSLFLSLLKITCNYENNFAGYSKLTLGRQPTRRILYTFSEKC
jgi:hypothetical protein